MSTATSASRNSSGSSSIASKTSRVSVAWAGSSLRRAPRPLSSMSSAVTGRRPSVRRWLISVLRRARSR
jgi:hypothetical protein